MKNRKRISSDKKMIKFIWVIVAVAVCVVIGLGVLINANKDNGKNTADNEDLLKGLYTQDIEGYDIETSYGNLVFPEQWSGYVKTEIVKENDCETVEFWLALDGKEKIHVFDIIFGGEGYKVGSINEGDTEIDVCVESYNYDIDDAWSDDEKEILSSMEHDINYLLENLSNLENFTPIG